MLQAAGDNIKADLASLLVILIQLFAISYQLDEWGFHHEYCIDNQRHIMLQVMAYFYLHVVNVRW